MKKVCQVGIAAVIAWTAAMPRAEASSIIFNDISRFDIAIGRSADQGPLAAITVSAPTSIDQIGVYNDLFAADGDLKFLIFNLDTQAPLFESSSEAFVDDGLSFKLSNPFAPFTLLPGINYGIGAIADVEAAWGLNGSSSGNPYTENGITVSDDRNGNASNFASPTLFAEGAAMIIVELGTGPAATPVPEPGTIALVGGAAMLLLRRRART